jgi:hypothetical protein
MEKAPRLGTSWPQDAEVVANWSYRAAFLRFRSRCFAIHPLVGDPNRFVDPKPINVEGRFYEQNLDLDRECADCLPTES